MSMLGLSTIPFYKQSFVNTQSYVRINIEIWGGFILLGNDRS